MLNPEELAYKEPAKKKFSIPKLPKPHFSKPSKRSGIIFSSLFGIVLLAGGGWYSYLNLQKQFNQPKEEPKQEAPPQQVLGLIEAVESKGAELPDNEFPSVATISNLSTLSDQAFFNGAAVGDKVLIYAVAKRAILYRPSTNQIVRESRVEIGREEESATPASESAILSASDSAEPILRIKF